jgi:hypothetical protein
MAEYLTYLADVRGGAVGDMDLRWRISSGEPRRTHYPNRRCVIRGPLRGRLCTLLSTNAGKASTKFIDVTTLTTIDKKRVTSAELAPIIAFEFNIVAPPTGASTVFSSGAESITFSASTPRTALGVVPAKAGGVSTVSGETATTAYGLMQADSGTSLTQLFRAYSSAPKNH